MDYCQRHTHDLDEVRRRYEGRSKVTEPRRLDAGMVDEVMEDFIRMAGLTPAKCKGCGRTWPKEKLLQYDLCPDCDYKLGREVDEMIECQIEAAKLEAKDREEREDGTKDA